MRAITKTIEILNCLTTQKKQIDRLIGRLLERLDV